MTGLAQRGVMRCIAFDQTGGAEVLHVAEAPLPEPRESEILIRVAAAGVNRADILQRRGKYPPPEGASPILGLEVCGVVENVGAYAERWKRGDRVCALLSGGGYAEYVCARWDHALPIPSGLSLAEAATLPEAVVTVWANLFETAALKAGDCILVHGGAGGIGSMAIQLAKRQGARVFVTAGTEEKCIYCKSLGAEITVDYQRQDYVRACLDATNGRGVDVVLDLLGGEYVGRNMSVLAPLGRHISLAFMKGRESLVNIKLLMDKRLVLTGSTLKGRSSDDKARLVRAVETNLWPWVASGAVKPQLKKIFPLENASEAHKNVESGAQMGKIALEVVS